MDERITPERVVAYAAGLRGVSVDDLALGPVVVLSWMRGMVESLAEAAGAELSGPWLYGEQWPVYTGEVEGQGVSLALVPVGAPGTVMYMEEMIACGARTFIGVGYAGSLQPTAPVGTFLLPDACIREEGTSAHYLDSETPVGPSARLAGIVRESCEAEGVEVVSGPVWTTDAVFRELVSKVETYRRQGVIGVDMETSAMYALGRFRGVEVCNLLVVSDELWEEWRPAFGSAELRDAHPALARVVMRCLGVEGLGG